MVEKVNRYKTENGIDYKQCSICEEWFIKGKDNFYNNGKSPYCKECEKKKTTQYTKEHPEERKQWLRKHNQTDSFKANKNRFEREKRADGTRRNWENKNRDKINKYSKEYYSNKKHKINTKEWISCKNYFDNKCAYCGLPINEHYIKYNGNIQLGDFHKEHVNHYGENDISNCVPSCKICNSSKHTEDMETWYKRQSFYNEEKLNKIYKWINKDYKLYVVNKNKIA